MNIVVLRKGNSAIELLVSDDFDLSLITSNASQLFEISETLKKALSDFMNDHSKELEPFDSMISELKNAGAIGYPITPMKDARLYAGDKGIVIESELEIDCNEC